MIVSRHGGELSVIPIIHTALATMDETSRTIRSKMHLILGHVGKVVNGVERLIESRNAEINTRRCRALSLESNRVAFAILPSTDTKLQHRGIPQILIINQQQQEPVSQ